jgi:hypothetical protein
LGLCAHAVTFADARVPHLPLFLFFLLIPGAITAAP